MTFTEQTNHHVPFEYVFKMERGKVANTLSCVLQYVNICSSRIAAVQVRLRAESHILNTMASEVSGTLVSVFNQKPLILMPQLPFTSRLKSMITYLDTFCSIVLSLQKADSQSQTVNVLKGI